MTGGHIIDGSAIKFRQKHLQALIMLIAISQPRFKIDSQHRLCSHLSVLTFKSVQIGRLGWKLIHFFQCFSNLFSIIIQCLYILNIFCSIWTHFWPFLIHFGTISRALWFSFVPFWLISFYFASCLIHSCFFTFSKYRKTCINYQGEFLPIKNMAKYCQNMCWNTGQVKAETLEGAWVYNAQLPKWKVKLRADIFSFATSTQCWK